MKRLLVLLALTATALAQQIALAPNTPAHVSLARDGHTIQFKPLGHELRVIVEFRDTPLFARRTTTTLHASALRAAQFEQDLRRIHSSRTATESIKSAPRITHTYSRVYSGASVIIDAADLPAIRQLDYVAAVHLDREEHALLDKSVAKISAPGVWSSFGTRGRGVTVAIIDTGIDYNHPAFGGGFGAGHRVAGGYDFANDDDDPMDDFGHGTHVAGIVGANGGGLTGVAPDVQFLAYKVLDNTGSGYDSWILAAVESAADPNGDGNPADHADVANLSLGRPGTPDDAVSKAIDIATNAGVVFCIAAGNDGGFFTISTPANAPSAIAVGATDDNDRMADFSSKGPVAGSLAVKPEVVAPGVRITSAKMGGDTVAESGTSMATPHIAGVAALLKALHPTWTPAMIKSAIVQTAIPLGNEAMVEGAGRVDALRAAQCDLFALPSTISFGRDRISSPMWTATQTFTLTNGSNHSMTLSLTNDVRDGVTVGITPAAFALAPGQSQTITLLLQVDNALVPSPKQGSLAYGGTIRIAGSAMTTHIPWAFVKAAELTIATDDSNAFNAIVSGTDSLTFAVASADIDQRSVRVIVPVGDYDVDVSQSSQDGTYRWILLEHQQASDADTVQFSPAMARYAVDIVASDERGRPLEFGRECNPSYSLIGSDNSGSRASIAILFGDTRLLMSSLSDRFSLVPTETCMESGSATVYAAQFAPLRGLTGSITRTLDASAWKKVPMRIAVPADAKRPEAVLEPGILVHGATWALGVAFGDPKPATAGTVWSADGFMTTEQDSHACATITAEVKMAPPPPAEDLPPEFPSLARFSGVRSPAVRQTARGIDLWLWSTPDPSTYVPRPGEQLTFGTGLFSPRSFIFIDKDIGLFTNTYWAGGFGDARNAEANGVVMTLYDEANNVVQSAPVFLDPWAEVGEEKYRLEISGPRSHVTARFDTSQADHAPPFMTSMRLLDGSDTIATDLFPHANGALLFSALDYVPLPPNDLQWGPIRIEATSVHWRPHGSATWRELPYTIVANEVVSDRKGADALGHPPIGTLFRCDLAPVTREPALIDLQMHVEDPAGNSYEYTLAPAFGVGVPGRGRAVGR